MKTFALVAHTDRNMVWFATGSYDDMVSAMHDQIATSNEENHFMVIRVYDSGNGALNDDGNLV